MIEIKDGKISFNKSRQLTPRQLATLKNCSSESERNRYLMTLLGVVKARVYVPRIRKVGVMDPLIKPRNSILNLMRSIRRIDHDHRPNNSNLGDWIGVEIECFIPKDAISGDYEACGDCDDCNDGAPQDCSYASNGDGDAHKWLKDRLTQANVNRCCVKYDGSLHDDDGHGVEITILFNSKYGFEPLERLCAALNKAGCYVNKTCGLHVHLDSRHLTRAKILKIGKSLGHALPVLQYLVAESRRANSYCELQVSRLNGNRYYAINLTAFSKYQTIEVRLHQGSINAKKIKNWIEVLKLISASKLKYDITTFQGLIDLGLSDELVDYCDKRITELNPTAWGVLMPRDGTSSVTGESIPGVISQRTA